ATRLHSLIVRSRGRCENCRDAWRPTRSKLQCAPIVSRRYSRTRTDRDHPLCWCARCHLGCTAWPVEYAAFLVRKLGQEAYDALRAKAQGLGKVDWYEELDRLRAIAERLGVAA